MTPRTACGNGISDFDSTDAAKSRKCFEEPEAHLADPARQERDSGEHEKAAHRLFHFRDVAAEAREKARERLHGEAGDEERNAEPSGVDREQTRAFRHRR